MTKAKTLSLFNDANFLLFVGFLTICACREPEKPVKKSVRLYNIEDTTSLKIIKWTPLNEFVSYHIVKEGTVVKDTGLKFSMLLLAHRYTINGHFDIEAQEATKNDTTDNSKLLKQIDRNGSEYSKANKPLLCAPSFLRQFILSDKFSDRSAFKCLLKINSKIYYKLDPDLLKRITVRPKAENIDSVKLLVSKLRKQKFVENVKERVRQKSILDTLDRWANTRTKPFLITITIKPAYRNLKDLPKICEQLKRWTNIDEAIYVSMFTGLSNDDSYFRLTSTK
jgi:hypothetical protein